MDFLLIATSSTTTLTHKETNKNIKRQTLLEPLMFLHLSMLKFPFRTWIWMNVPISNNGCPEYFVFIILNLHATDEIA